MLLLAHVVALPVFGILRGAGLVHSLAEAALLLVPLAVGLDQRRSRGFRALFTTCGLLGASAILVHLSGGTIEAHFHFFIMVTLAILYQSWTPFLGAIAFVIAHHGIIGTLWPDSVYNHAAAISDPWTWAGIHGIGVAGAGAAGLVVWKRNEELRASWEEASRKLIEAEMRQKQALEINDNILQGLVVAEYAFSMGQQDMGRDAMRRALEGTRRVITDLIGDDERLEPGDLVRAAAAPRFISE